MSHDLLVTRWEGTDLVVLRNGVVAERIATQDIRRVILVCDGGDTPSELAFVLIETATDHVLLPAESGIAGHIYFERQAWWTERACIYWVAARQAVLPRPLRPGLWLLRRQQPVLLRLPAADLEPLIAQWPLEGPQTWEQRKWARIAARTNPLATQNRLPK